MIYLQKKNAIHVFCKRCLVQLDVQLEHLENTKLFINTKLFQGTVHIFMVRNSGYCSYSGLKFKSSVCPLQPKIETIKHPKVRMVVQLTTKFHLRRKQMKPIATQNFISLDEIICQTTKKNFFP